jgi:uncharacterized protein (TIGR02145 family)
VAEIKQGIVLARTTCCYGTGGRAITSSIIFSRFYREEYAAIFKRGSVAGSLEIAMTFVFRQVYKRSQTIILNVRGLLAGNRNTDGSFNNQSSNANFWSSLASGGSAWNRNLNSGNATVNRNTNNQANGFSVRCVRTG